MNNSFQKTTKLGLAGRLTHLFLHNKVLAMLTIIVIVVWGVLSFIIMPKQYNPEIVAPAFMITTDYPNATSAEVYELITRPMEDSISELTKIDAISSQSFPGGRSVVIVKFDIGSNQENAKISLNQKLQDNVNLKPAGAMNSVVQAIDPDDVPIMDIGLTSEVYSESSLRKLAQDISNELKRINGVSKIAIVGGETNNLHVTPKSAELAVRGISLDEISGAIAGANNIYTTDTIKGEGRNAIININGNIQSKEEIAKLIVRSQNGVPVRLDDVADITYDAGEINHYVTLHKKDVSGQAVTHIALAKLKGVNATTVATMVEKRLQEIKNSIIPATVEVELLRNEGKTAGDEIGKLTFDLAKSIAIVALLLLVFLGMRNSLVASISIPLVLLVVFGLGLLWGQTVNRITLFALILSLGLLVDDAIVVIENIARYFRLYPNEDKKTVIVEAVNEVGSALSLSTITMALAFIPMAFVTGMMGPYMGPIPFFVPVSLLVSLVLSVTINPFLAYIFTASTIKKEKRPNIFLRAFAKVEYYYEKLLVYLLAEKKRYRNMMLWISVLFVLSIILPLTPLVPFRMLPKADRDQFYVYVDLPQGTPVEKTREYAEHISSMLLGENEVEAVEDFVGIAPVVDFNGLFRGSNMRVYEQQATLRINLTPHEERIVSSEEIARNFREMVGEYIASNPGLQVSVVEDPPGPPVLATFLLKIKGEDAQVRDAIAMDMSRQVENIKGVVDIDISNPDPALNYTYRINTQKAQLLGVSPQAIASTLRTAISGAPVGIYHADEKNKNYSEQEYIIVRLNQADRNSLSILESLSVIAQSGVAVPLREVLEASDQTFDMPIVSDERQKTTYVSGEMENRSVVYAVIDLLKNLRNYQINDRESKLIQWSLLGATYQDLASGQEYTIQIDGEWKLTLEVFRDLGIAMAIAIFAIYFVLATKVGSLNVPLLIMVSIPLGMIGVFPGFAALFLIKGTYFNATSMIGVIALAGLSVKNSVIFLEYLEPLREKGMPLAKALVETGRIRLLPIVLTSLTAILGSLTIISDPVWEGLAWALIFGLTMSTFLTLIVFPIVYYAVERKKW
ncbi:MAG: efflux RND transporter permease subunit [Parcubacteria group bacterium]|jgi:multidrug efflux pump subunit AcrB